LTKIIDNKEQCDHPPQAARSFATILKTTEIMQLQKIAESKVAISRIKNRKKQSINKMSIDRI